ncbi:MAG: hypothetical protein KME64_05150 [Scytonematopsis contorta HA4267-MV1]|nr:hypothetical protein [Scytonematopsis contorta HA4267-MV1]
MRASRSRSVSSVSLAFCQQRLARVLSAASRSRSVSSVSLASVNSVVDNLVKKIGMFYQDCR